MARPRKTVSVHEKITLAAGKLAQAQKAQTDALAALGDLFREGRDQKVSVVAMTQSSGLSRSTVYRLMDEKTAA